MSKICKKYISEIKAFFPARTRQEKEYLKRLEADVNDYCLDADVKTIDTLYANYGKPEDVVHNYFSTSETSCIIKKIRMTRFIKTALAITLVLATVATATFCVVLYNEYQMAKRQEVVICQTTITEFN